MSALPRQNASSTCSYGRCIQRRWNARVVSFIFSPCSKRCRVRGRTGKSERASFTFLLCFSPYLIIIVTHFPSFVVRSIHSGGCQGSFKSRRGLDSSESLNFGAPYKIPPLILFITTKLLTFSSLKCTSLKHCYPM